MAEIIEMPKLSDTMTTGTLVKWLKKEGDAVESGDIIAEVETDKATMEVDNFIDGTILKLYVEEGGQVPIKTPICAIGEPGEEAPAVDTPAAAPAEEKSEAEEKEAPTQEAEKEKPAPATTQPATEAAAPAAPAAADDKDIKASPLARKLAAEKNIPLNAIKGTGPQGRIVKKDVLEAESKGVTAAPAQSASAPVAIAAAEDKSIPVSNMRRVIATRLVESKTQIPHFYLDIEVDAAPLLKLRAELNKNLAELPPEQGGIKLTVNDFILKASAEALRRVPAVNASWMGDTILQHGSVNMAFGVAIDDGLVTPVIRNAEAKGLRQVSAEAKELIGKARSKKLTPNEMTGSTFTVTNLGMFGTSGFFGIINPPNAAILSVGATIKKPVVDANDNIVVGQRMNLGLSCDHRVVDGATGAEYLAALKSILETPALMLV